MDAVEQFSRILIDELNLDTSVDTVELLDVAKEVAHGVARPATPVATYLMGYAAGAGQNNTQIADAVKRAIARWQK